MNRDLLKKICTINGVSGHEGDIAEYIASQIKDYVDEYYVDPLGNLIAHKKGKGKKMMLAGHMDQIGMIITNIDEKGFLWFSNIGGLSPTNNISQRVRFNNGTIGVIACERIAAPAELNMEKLYIDIGAKNKEEAESYVKVGDVCNYASDCYIDGIKVVSPALDDRIGCFVMIEALKKIKKQKYDLYFVFTVQEEVGLRGARTSAFNVDPDYALAYDVTLTYDTPKAQKMPCKMNEGAAIKIKDSSVLCDPKIINHLEKCAKDAKVKYQFEILAAGGTDIGAIHVNKAGVPSGAISIPTRHIHSASEMASIADIEACVDLTVKALETDMK